MFEQLINASNTIIWNYILIALLIGTGGYYTFKLGFIQFRLFFHSFKLIFKLPPLQEQQKKTITPFQALCISLGARVGTGNIAGVAIALVLGGPGAIFWMWLVAVLGMATSVIECTLGQLFKVSNHDGSYRGGPAYYMEQGLRKRWLGIIFATLLIISFGFTFNAVQANTITAALQNVLEFEPYIIGIFIAAATAIIIFGGVKRIAVASQILVSVMAMIYLIVGIVVVMLNVEQVPGTISLVIKSAFGIHEAITGSIAYAIGSALKHGVTRGLFSNEAGMGSVPNAASVATPNPHHPVSQGLVQMLGVFFDTFVICTTTATFILLSNTLTTAPDASGVVLTQLALSTEIGSFGPNFVAVSLLFFAFSSIIANYYYGETNIIYIFNNTTALLIFRILVLIMIIFGANASFTLVWNMADAAMGLMAIVNLISILALTKVVLPVIDDYEYQIKAGKIPSFSAEKIPGLTSKLKGNIWH